MASTYQGSCHCGAIRFELTTDVREVLDCNCSICAKKGFLHLIVPDSALRYTGELATYTFGTHTAKHMFCPTCGIQPFYRPRSHPDSWDVNARCIDTVPLTHWQLRSFDGRDDWDAARAELRSRE